MINALTARLPPILPSAPIAFLRTFRSSSFRALISAPAARLSRRTPSSSAAFARAAASGCSNSRINANICSFTPPSVPKVPGNAFSRMAVNPSSAVNNCHSFACAGSPESPPSQAAVSALPSMFSMRMRSISPVPRGPRAGHTRTFFGTARPSAPGIPTRYAIFTACAGTGAARKS